MKKILVIDQGEHLGGAERFLSDLLVKSDHEFEWHLITEQNQEYLNRYKKSSVKIHSIAMPSLKPLGWKAFKNMKEAQKNISKIIDDIHPEMILSNTVRTHILVSPLAKKMNIPLVWMAHDTTFPRTLLKWFIGYPQKIICCSQHVKEFYQSARKKIINAQVLYPYGIENQTLLNLKKKIKKPIIGMIGNFIPWKGHDIFIRMAAEIHQDYPQYSFAIIGQIYKDDPESNEFYKKCSELVHQLGLSNVLHTYSSENVLDDIADWEIFVHCSRRPEPLGRVILEGMSAGCAVIASELGGPKEIIHQGENGILTKPSLSNLTHTIRNLLAEPDRRKVLQGNAQDEIQEHFLWGQTMERFKEMLKNNT